MTELFDTSVWLGEWPFSYLHPTEAVGLAELLEAEGIETAVVSTTEAVFNPDYVRANEILFERIDTVARLVPAVVVDPTIPGWRPHLESWLRGGAVAVRVLPTYHGYSLSDWRFSDFVDSVEEFGVPLLVQVRMEDERSHHYRAQVPPVETSQILTLAKARPGLTIIACCMVYHEALRALSEGSENLCVDLAFIEILETVATLMARSPARRVLLGTHAPFLAIRSAVMKLSDPSVDESTRRIIGRENWRDIFRR